MYSVPVGHFFPAFVLLAAELIEQLFGTIHADQGLA